MAKELKLKAFKIIHVSRRDTNVRLKRKTRARNLNDRYSAESVKRIAFTDEKDLTYEIARNRQNDRLYGTRKMEIPPARLYHETSPFTKKLWRVQEYLGTATRTYTFLTHFCKFPSLWG
jgi:hypothetical protein